MMSHYAPKKIYLYDVIDSDDMSHPAPKNIYVYDVISTDDVTSCS